MPQDKSPKDEADAPEEPAAKPQGRLDDAYLELMRAAGTQIDTSALKGVSEAFAGALDASKMWANLDMPVTRMLTQGEIATLPQSHIDYELPEVLIDPAPSMTAKHTKRIAYQMEGLNEVTARMMTLTATNVELTKKQHESSERMERFSKRATIASIVIGAASLAAAIAAVVASIAFAR